MNRTRLLASAVPLVIGIGLILAGCVAEPVDYSGGGYVSDPILGLDYGGWGGWHHGWDHGHWDHGHWGRAGGHGFAHAGLGEHGGFGEHSAGAHGIGGHGGGGHR